MKKLQGKRTAASNGKRPALSRKAKLMTRELLLKNTEHDPKGTEEFVGSTAPTAAQPSTGRAKTSQKVILIDTDVVSYLFLRGTHSPRPWQHAWRAIIFVFRS